MPTYPIRSAPPWHFRLAKWLIRNRIRGGYRLIELAEGRGWLKYMVEYELSKDVKFAVPLWRRENQWALPDLMAYEKDLVSMLAEPTHDLPPPIRWIDVGADIGTISALVASQSPPIAEAILLEPNPVPFEFLSKNAARLPFPARALMAAAADFCGKGKLSHPPADPSDHARFLVPAEDGDLEVIRIDDLDLLPGGSIVMKVDVEGGELAVLKGAEQTLRSASHWCVALEAHREVVARTGIDPCECIRFLASIGGVDARVAECPEVLQLDSDLPYFDQVSEKITNIVCLHFPDS